MLFADDISLFSAVYDSNASRDAVNGNSEKIAEWAFQWKMQFNPDLKKQAQGNIFSRKTLEAQGNIFSRKTLESVYSAVQFNDSAVACVNIKKQVDLFLNEKLKFSHHIKEKLDKAMKGVSVIKKLSNVPPRHTLVTIYKSFVRPHLDYGDICPPGQWRL